MKTASHLQRHFLSRENCLHLETDHSQTRIYFLGDGVVRLRTGFDSSFQEGSLSLLRTAWADPYDDLLGSERTRVEALLPRIQETDKEIRILCDGIQITLQKDPFAFSIGPEGQPPLFRDVSGRSYQHFSHQVRHSFCLDNSLFYGFGEKTGPLEKTGRRMRFSNKDACGYDPKETDPLYKHLPMFLKLDPVTRQVCGIFYHTDRDCTLDMGKEYNGYWPRMGQFTSEGEDVDLFFLLGPSMEDVVTRFARLTGLPLLLPRYALGYLGSTMFYSELAENCDEEILSFVRHTREEEVPCSNFQLSSGYTTDRNCKRNVFSWNREKFPDPEAFLAAMEAMDAPVTPNIKPALLTTNPLYETFREAGAFIQMPDGSPYITRFWGGEGSFVDFSSSAGRSLWQRYAEQNLLRYGIHSLWNDNNEFDIEDDNALCANEGAPLPAAAIRGRLPLLMNLTGKQVLEHHWPNKRLYQVSRSGSAGICRYAQTWTGDNRTGWDTLRYNIATMLGCSLSGLPLTGSDVGGFAGSAPERELFLRWLWCGVLMPRFSIHSANDDNTVTEPWMYPKDMEIVRSAFSLRERLMPYLYSLHALSSRTGVPIWRPMVYEFPEDDTLYREDTSFMLGQALLCAPVVEEGAVSRQITFPRGQDFYQLESGEIFSGGQTCLVPAPLTTVPLYQRGGSILPLQEGAEIVLSVAPETACYFTLWEDDGQSNDYRQGLFLATTFHASLDQGKLTLTCETQGSYLSRTGITYRIQCRGKAPREVIWNDSPLPQILHYRDFAEAQSGWHYDHGSRRCLIRCDNGRDLQKLTVNFGTFDLIRMDG